MRLNYDGGRDSGDGFSTSFSDMVFGLLFVFFLLSIALIFQRPEVDQFQDRIDVLERHLKEASILAADKKKLSEQLLNKNEKLTSWASSLARKEKAVSNALDKKTKHIDRLQTAIRRLQKRNAHLTAVAQKRLQNYKTLKVQFDRLRKNKADQSTVNQLRNVTKKLENSQKHRDKLARDKAEMKSILGSVKKLLRDAGYMDILAELADMEGKLESRGKGQGVEQVVPPSRIEAKYDPRTGFIDATVEYSQSDLQHWREIWEEDLLNIAKELRKEYKDISESYTELEKKENRPKFYLAIHPDTPHWQVQEILTRIKSAIPVVIVPWDDAAAY